MFRYPVQTRLSKTVVPELSLALTFDISKNTGTLMTSGKSNNYFLSFRTRSCLALWGIWYCRLLMLIDELRCFELGISCIISLFVNIKYMWRIISKRDIYKIPICYISTNTRATGINVFVLEKYNFIYIFRLPTCILDIIISFCFLRAYKLIRLCFYLRFTV